jgi:hypothetical protein
LELFSDKSNLDAVSVYIRILQEEPMKPLPQPLLQKSFVVTVWQQPENSVACGEQWRFCLEDPLTNHKRIFANPQALIVALKEGALDSERVKQ